jgi:ParB family chromosome partitioning protein
MSNTSALEAAVAAAHGPAPKPAPRPATVAATVPVSLPAEGQLVEVLLELVEPDPGNPRESMGDLTELMESMAEHGLIQPLIVRRTGDEQLMIVAGHRRHEAAKRLGWRRIEVVVRRDMPPDDVLAKMLVENGQRAGLDPIEEARALLRLKKMGGLSDLEVGGKVGLSQITVSGRIALLSLPVEEQEAIRAKRLGVVAGVRMARIAAGTVRKTGIGRAWHLGPDHALSRLAAARCRRLAHKAGRMVGGMACGECWESVIRADERQHLAGVSASSGSCPVCGATS